MTEHEIKMIGLKGGANCICQMVDVGESWITIKNPVACSHDAENNRLNMTPLLRFGAKNTDTKIPASVVEMIYQPTEGLMEEYIMVFIEEKAIETETEEEETVEEETVEA